MFSNTVTLADCLPIQCGTVTQSDAGYQKLVDCSNAGFVGARSPFDPVCGQYRPADSISIPVPPGQVMPVIDSTPKIVTPPAYQLTAEDLSFILPSMPSTPHPTGNCDGNLDVVYREDGGVEMASGVGISEWMCRVGQWATHNPLLALGVLAGAYVLAGESAKKRQARVRTATRVARRR